LSDPTTDNHRFLRGVTLRGTLAGGHRIHWKASVGIALRFTAEGALLLDVDAQSLIIEQGIDGSAPDGSSWMFYLTNFGSRCGDIATRPLPKRYQSDDS
jgi:hypothetical protein